MFDPVMISNMTYNQSSMLVVYPYQMDTVLALMTIQTVCIAFLALAKVWGWALHGSSQ